MNMKKLICAILAVMMLCMMTACRSGGSETTGPSVSGNVPNVTTPVGTNPGNQGIVDLTDPTDPIEETTEPIEETTEPTEEPTDPEEDPDEDPLEDPTDPDEDPVEPTEEPTDPEDDDPPVETTQPTEPQTGSDEPVVLTYEEYMALSPEEQQAYYESFPTLEEFIAWHNAALEEYEANNTVPVVTGPIDIGDYINP